MSQRRPDIDAYIDEITGILRSAADSGQIAVDDDGLKVVAGILRRHHAAGEPDLPDHLEIIVDSPGSATWRIHRDTSLPWALRLAHHGMSDRPHRDAAARSVSADLRRAAYDLRHTPPRTRRSA